MLKPVKTFIIIIIIIVVVKAKNRYSKPLNVT